MSEAPNEDENPYAAPSNLRPPWQPSPEFRGPSAIQPTTISVSVVISRAWRIYLKRLGKLLLAHIVSGVVFFAAIIAYQVAIGWAIIAVGPLAVLAILSLPLVVFAVALSLLLGQIQFTLKVARGEKAGLGDLFGAITGVPAYLVATLIFTAMTSIGYLFCFVPGIYLALTFGSYPFALIDRREGPFACLESAAIVSKGNRLSLLALYLVVGVCIAIVGICCSIVGTAGGTVDPEEDPTLLMATMGPAIFLLWPYLLLVQCVAYLMMAGQPVIDPDAQQPTLLDRA